MSKFVKNATKNRDNPLIRTAMQADLPAIVEIYNQNVITKQATADLVAVTVAQKQAWFEAHSLEKNRPMLVAVKADKIVGWSTLSHLYDRAAYYIAAEISVYIDNTAKGRGLGQLLVKRQLELAPTCGVQQVVAKIFGHNQASLNLFTKLGFTQWGVLPQVCDMDGFIADVVLLGRKV